MAILDLIALVHLASFVTMLQKIVEIFHILWLFLIYHNLYWGWLPSDSYYFSFFYINFFGYETQRVSYSSLFHFLLIWYLESRNF